MISLFWLTTAASAFVTFAAFARRSRVQELRNGAVAIDTLRDENALVIIAAFVLTMLVVTSAIGVAVWTLRLVSSAQARQVSGLSAGWAVGGWFVPIGFLFLGFRQAARAVAGVGGSIKSIIAWQVSFAATTLVMAIAQTTSQDIESTPDFDTALAPFTTESYLSLASTVLFVLSATFATVALIRADRDVVQRSQTGRLAS